MLLNFSIRPFQKLLLCDDALEVIKEEDSILPKRFFTELLLEEVKSKDTSLTLLNLSDQKLNDDHIQLLVSALSDNHTLKMLILYNNRIRNTGAVALANLLNYNKTIATLFLNKNLLQSQGATVLASALTHNKSLMALYVGENSIGDKGAADFGEMLAHNTQLSILDLNTNDITDSGLKALGDGLKHNTKLIALRLTCNDFKSDKPLVECLRHNNTLKILSLDFCFMSAEGAIGGVIKALKEQKNLESLVLDSNWIKPEDSADIEALVKNNCSLKELSLYGNNIGETGAFALARALRQNYTLKSLNLAWNQLSRADSDEKGIIALAHSLKKHPSIVSVQLSQNQIHEKGVAALLMMLEENHQITLLGLGEGRNRPERDNKVSLTERTKLDELIKRNQEKLKNTAEYLVKHFLACTKPPDEIDLEILKFYQVCNHEMLLFDHLGFSIFNEISINIKRHIATNFLKLTRCLGNGKSTIEQLSPQLHYKIFSFLDLNQVLWLDEITEMHRMSQIDGHKDQDAHLCSMF